MLGKIELVDLGRGSEELEADGVGSAFRFFSIEFICVVSALAELFVSNEVAKPGVGCVELVDAFFNLVALFEGPSPDKPELI